MPPRLLPCIGLVTLALLLVGPAQALAHGEGPQQIIDGYTLTLVLPEQGFSTGQNPLTVLLWDEQGRAVDATLITATLLVFTPASAGHGETHAATDAQTHSAVDSHNDSAHAAMPGMADMPDMADISVDSNAHTEAAAASASAGHEHDAASASQGLAAAPIDLAVGTEAGEYQSDLSFDKPGTWTVSVAFTIDGQERGAIFELTVAQSRPRGLVLGGFALVNALAIGTAAVLRRRTPRKLAKPAHPAPAATTAEEQH